MSLAGRSSSPSTTRARSFARIFVSPTRSELASRPFSTNVGRSSSNHSPRSDGYHPRASSNAFAGNSMTRDAVAVSGASSPRPANAAATARLDVGATSHRTRSGAGVDASRRASRRNRQGVTSTSAAPASSPAGTDARHCAAAISPSRVNRIDSNGAGGRADADAGSDSRDVVVAVPVPGPVTGSTVRSVASTSTRRYVGSAARLLDPFVAARADGGFSRPTRGSVAPGGTRVTRPPGVRTHASTPSAFTTGRLAGTAASARLALAVAAMTSSAKACVSTARNGVAPETRSVVPSG